MKCNPMQTCSLSEPFTLWKRLVPQTSGAPLVLTFVSQTLSLKLYTKNLLAELLYIAAWGETVLTLLLCKRITPAR